MRSILRFSVFVLLALCVPASVSADVFAFQAEKTGADWACSGAASKRQTKLDVALTLPTAPPSDATVNLTATVERATGAPLTGSFTKDTASSVPNVWRFVHNTEETTAKSVKIGGTIEGKEVKCDAALDESEGGGTSTPLSRSTMKNIDLAAAEWLDRNGWRLDAMRGAIKEQNRKIPLDRIVFLPHLPSGAKAPAYPTSISEREVAQVVMVVPDDENAAGIDGSIDWSLTRCETIPTYRVRGSIEGLAGAESAERGKKPPIKFKLIRLGHLMSCGADALAYTLIVTDGKGVAGDPIPSSVTVRPVFNIGATGMFGFDATKQSTYSIRDGKIYDARDNVGTGLLAGGTYFVKGLDAGDMRWYNHFVNPFVVVSLESPKERFVVGTVLMERVGFGLALGVAFNHVDVLGKGYTVGQEFAGEGDIPVDKDWKRGFYIGVAMDNTLFSQFRKLKKSGGGGGTGQAADVKVAEDKKKAEDDKKDKDEAAAEDEAKKKAAEEAAAAKKKASGNKPN